MAVSGKSELNSLEKISANPNSWHDYLLERDGVGGKYFLCGRGSWHDYLQALKLRYAKNLVQDNSYYHIQNR